METHVKQKTIGSKPFGITNKLGWINNRLVGRLPPTISDNAKTSPADYQATKELRDFQAEFECKRAQGLIEAERLRSLLIR